MKNTANAQFCNQIALFFEHLFKSTGLTYFEFNRIYNDGRTVYLNSRSDYLTHFFQKQYSRPSSEVYTKSGIFLWAGIPDLYTFDGQMLDMRINFNIDNGVSFVEKYPDYINVYDYASTSHARHIINYCINHQNVLHQYYRHFVEKFANIINVSILKPGMIPLRPKLIQLEPFASNNLLGLMTDREMECIMLLRRGLSAKLMAQNLNISVRTVERHIENIKHKLNVKTKAEILSQFVR